MCRTKKGSGPPSPAPTGEAPIPSSHPPSTALPPTAGRSMPPPEACTAAIAIGAHVAMQRVSIRNYTERPTNDQAQRGPRRPPPVDPLRGPGAAASKRRSAGGSRGLDRADTSGRTTPQNGSARILQHGPPAQQVDSESSPLVSLLRSPMTTTACKCGLALAAPLSISIRRRTAPRSCAESPK